MEFETKAIFLEWAGGKPLEWDKILASLNIMSRFFFFK
jgi:hypothetical protein